MKTLYLFFILPMFIFAQEMQTRTQIQMGTLVSLTLPSHKEALFSKAFSLIQSLETVLSSYDKNALVYGLNHRHTVMSHPSLVEALTVSQQYYKETQGYFDITIGSLSKNLYHFGEEKERIPLPKEVDSIVLNIKGIMYSPTEITTERNITLDLGGMGKGYTVDKVALLLQEHNTTKGIIALSGDMRCLDICKIGLQSPYSEQPFASIESKVPNLSISTSGTYRRYIQNPKNHHLLNPKTASQGKDFVSVSLFTIADNSKIDAYATAISVMPKEEAYAFLKKHSEIGFVVVETKGKVRHGNLEKFIDLKYFNL